jgi:protein O-mannosyl-transferase
MTPLSGIPRRRIALVVSALLLVAFQLIVYLPVVNNGFVHYDDNTYVYENKNVRTLNGETIAAMFTRPYFHSYTPVALLSHAIDYALWKNNPFGHHLVSLLLHSVNVVLIFFLTAAILARYRARTSSGLESGMFSNPDPGIIIGATAATLLFSLHPMRVESVAWISDRKDLLLCLFLISSVLAYLKYDGTRGKHAAAKWLIVAIVFNLLALLSKTIATVTPLVLLSLDWLLLHRNAALKEWKGLLLEKTPFFVMSAVFAGLALWASPGSNVNRLVAQMTGTQRVLLPLYSLAFYPVKTILPFGLTPIYPLPPVDWMAAGAVLALALIGISLWALRKGHYIWTLVLAGYAIPLLPTITGISAGIQPWADRYSYLPSIALFMLAGAMISFVWERSSKMQTRLGAVAAVAVLAVAYGFADRNQISIWRDSESLWQAALTGAPSNPDACDNLGIALAERGDFEGALSMYHTAIHLQPDFADPYYNAAVIFQGKGMRDSAFTYYSYAIAVDTQYVDAYINLANLLAGEDNRDAAISLYERALRLDGSNADAYYNLGCVVYLTGDRERALTCFQKATFFSPGYANAYYNMGIIFLDEKKNDLALDSFIRAARLGSSDAQNTLTRAGYSWH